jgi:ABC-type sugar transport system ATPase subunit
VHQEKVLCPHVSVAENVFMGQRILTKGGAVDYKKMFRETEKLIECFGVKLDPAIRLRYLNVSNQQVVEIARALARNVKILIFDEPTSSLSERETEKLFEIIQNLKEKGISILYISHRMSEIFRLCDRVTVLRDGKLIETLQTKETTPEKIVNLMVGREITQIFPEKMKESGEIMFKVEDLCRKGYFEHISFELKKGEILGISRFHNNTHKPSLK